MSEKIEVTYRGQAITYNEQFNKWDCELFSKPADSLESAKKRIDDKLDKEKKEPFQRFDVYTTEYKLAEAGRYAVATVTGLTDDGQEAWVSNGKERRKVTLKYSQIFDATPENTNLVAQIHSLKDQADALNDKISQLSGKLKAWKPKQ